MDCRKEPTEKNVPDQIEEELIDDLPTIENYFKELPPTSQADFVLVEDRLQNRSEGLAGYHLSEIMDSHRDLVTSLGAGSVKYFTDKVVQLLKRSQRPVDLSRWKDTFPQENLDKNEMRDQCARRYENCKFKEASGKEAQEPCQYSQKKALKRSREVDSSPPQENNNRDLKGFRSMEIGSNRACAQETHEETTIKLNPPTVDEHLPLRQQKQSKRETPKSWETGTSFTRHPQNDEANNDFTNEDPPSAGNCFRTANEEFILQYARRYGSKSTAPTLSNSTKNYASASKPNLMFSKHQTLPQGSHQQTPLFSYGASKKSLGTRRTVHSKFVPPIRRDSNEPPTVPPQTTHLGRTCEMDSHTVMDERLKNIEPKMIELISNEIMTKFKPITWNDIAGLQYAKATIQEAVVWPMLRPDIFTGLRRPPRGILLFGPPGTGKTLIGKCIASQSKSTFFSISASSLTSKWIGDGEKMVRALFAVAAVHQPSVIFIDEVDSLLCQRSDTEHESSRRIKTEFLVQLDGAMTSEEEKILIVGATNRPQELDEAARRRFTRRLYIPLPEKEARLQILENLLRLARHSLTEIEIDSVAQLADGYSGADMESLCREASMEPIRSIPPEEILYFKEDEVRPISLADFRKALNRIRASVSQQDLTHYVRWNEIYGSGAS